MPSEAQNKEQNQPKRFSFSLSTTGVASLTVIGAVALAWVFILGVLVGRGYHPEQAVPHLAQLMPQAEQQAPESETVLKAEDLEFYDNLQKKPGADSDQPGPAADGAPTEKPDSAAQMQQAPAQPAADQAMAQQPEIQQPQTQQADDQQAEIQPSQAQQFNFVYQVSSLKDPDMALVFAAKLVKMGLKTSIEQAEASGAIWHRVMVHFTGTPEATDELKATLAGVGVPKPILKSKQPL